MLSVFSRPSCTPSTFSTCSVCPGRHHRIFMWASLPSGSSVVQPERGPGSRSKSRRRRVVGVEFPGSFPSESSEQRLYSFPQSHGAVGWPSPADTDTVMVQLSLGSSDHSLPCPLGLEMVMAPQCITIFCWLLYTLPTHYFVNSSFTELSLLILPAFAICFLLGPD